LRVGRGWVLMAQPLTSCFYSPECVEVEFCELRIDGVLRSSGAEGESRAVRSRPSLNVCYSLLAALFTEAMHSPRFLKPKAS
jgi:hypothetical protein